nr:hypothetical protein C1892_23835 [Pseudomonas sp. MPBD7-1]
MLAMAVGQSTSVLTDTLLSRASSLPQKAVAVPEPPGISICCFDLVGALIRRGRCARIPRSNTARWPFIRKFS